jgi:hypothetical protein
VGFKERQAFDVAHRAADLDQDEILLLGVGDDEFTDGVGDMRDHLDRGAEIFAAPLLGDHRGVDAASRDVVGLAGIDAGEALVVAEVEIGLRPIVGDEDFAVLVGAHRPGIDVEIGVELAQSHAKAARLQQRAQRR